jgi:hypothetical protein
MRWLHVVFEVRHARKSRYSRSHRIYFVECCRPTRLMNPLVECAILTGIPSVCGLAIGYGVRTCSAMMREISSSGHVAKPSGDLISLVGLV